MVKRYRKSKKKRSKRFYKKKSFKKNTALGKMKYFTAKCSIIYPIYNSPTRDGIDWRVKQTATAYMKKEGTINIKVNRFNW